MRQKNERRGRKDHRRKQARPLKRLLHMEDGEVWSWQVFHGALMVRGPDGVNYKNLHEHFRTWEWIDVCDPCSELGHYIGPGFSPALIKRYIQVVLKDGGKWGREAEWAKHLEMT